MGLRHPLQLNLFHGNSRRAILLIAFFASACTQRSADQIANNQPAPALADHTGLLVARARVPGHLSMASGVLKMQDGCTVLDDGRTMYMLVWPAGTHFSPDRSAIVVAQDDGSIATYSLGSRVTLIGGGASQVDGGSTAYEAPGNAACKGPAWIVSSTRPDNGVLQ
jgi:hypothetical protein